MSCAEAGQLVARGDGAGAERARPALCLGLAGWGLLLPPNLGTPQAAGGGRAPMGVPSLMPAPRLPAGSRSTSTRTASCPTTRTSWPCRWAARGHRGDPRGHPTMGAAHHQRVWGRSAEQGPPLCSRLGHRGAPCLVRGGAGLVAVPRAHGLAAQPRRCCFLAAYFSSNRSPFVPSRQTGKSLPRQGGGSGMGWLRAGHPAACFPRAVPTGPGPASPCATGHPQNLAVTVALSPRRRRRACR